MPQGNMPNDSPKHGRPAPSPGHDPSPPSADEAVAQAEIASGPFGAELEPVLREACDGQLSPIRWFRTDWQRGGALTGHAQWGASDDARHVVVKFPVPPVELSWLIQLQDRQGLVPDLVAHATTLHGYDMAWVVMEHLPFGPIGSKWQGAEFDLLVDTAVRFHAASVEAAPDWERPSEIDWLEMAGQSRRSLKRHQIPQNQRWQQALRKTERKLPEWLQSWNARSREEWCHGDMHFANVMTRQPPPEGPGVLIDFARARPGHWVEDAVYFEHLFWSRRETLGGRKPCSLMARRRKQAGLAVDENWPQLAMIRRVLLAVTTPLKLAVHGHESHVTAALEVLEAAEG